MHTILRQRIEEGRLIPWSPSVVGDPCPRTLFISDVVNDDFDESTWKDVNVAMRYAQLTADFDRFVTGDMIPVGMEPYDKGENAFMARIDPVERGIWTIRSVSPRPALRVFGGFYGQDVFVALLTKRRTELGGPKSAEWAGARENAIAVWEMLLPEVERMKGEYLDDFISKKKIAV